MAALIGLVLALAVAVFAHLVGFDRERAFYPVVLIVVASYYVLFATMGGSQTHLQIALLFFALFSAVAIAGFRLNLWFAVAGLAMHGLFDFFNGYSGSGSGVPEWWPSFCGAYDVAAAACLALLLIIKPAGPSRANSS